MSKLILKAGIAAMMCVIPSVESYGMGFGDDNSDSNGADGNSPITMVSQESKAASESEKKKLAEEFKKQGATDQEAADIVSNLKIDLNDFEKKSIVVKKRLGSKGVITEHLTVGDVFTAAHDQITSRGQKVPVWTPDAVLYSMARNDFVKNLLFAVAAQVDAIDDTEKFKKKLNNARLLLLAQEYMENIINDFMKQPEDFKEKKYKEAYEKVVESLKNQKKFQYIEFFVKTKEQKDEMIEKLKNTTNYSDLVKNLHGEAKQHTVLRNDKFFNPEEIEDQTTRQILFAGGLKDGEVFKELVPIKTKNGNGFKIIKKIKEAPRDIPEYTKIKSQIQSIVIKQIVEEKQESLKKSCEVELFNIKGDKTTEEEEQKAMANIANKMEEIRKRALDKSSKLPSQPETKNTAAPAA